MTMDLSAVRVYAVAVYTSMKQQQIDAGVIIDTWASRHNYDADIMKHQVSLPNGYFPTLPVVNDYSRADLGIAGRNSN